MSFINQLRVMIADDHRTSRMLIVEGLAELGIRQVSYACDGEEALKAMMSTPCHIVISDVNMPKLDGMQLLRALRSYGPTKKVPFIFLTGNNDRDLIQRAAAAGANNILAKPISVPVLKKTLEAVLGRLQ